MNIAFIGIGHVGSALANHLQRAGHAVTIAARNPHSDTVKEAQTLNPALTARPVREAVANADVVFLATPFSAVEAALQEAGELTGKVVIDCTNPVGPGLTHGLDSQISGGELTQNLVPAAQVVKAFTIYGYENFENSAYPGYGDLKPAMFIAGNDSAAKEVVAGLCRQLGWEPVDAGNIGASLHLEHMTLLWIKMARVQGWGPNLVWAMLRR
jgi:hypothetical protein